MKISATKVFTWFFIIITVSVSLIQSISEIKNRKSIQFFDIFEDTFITHSKILKDNSDSFQILKSEFKKVNLILIDTNLPQDKFYDTLSFHLDEVQAIAEDIKRKSISVNRHISDSASTFISSIDSIISKISILVQSVPAEKETIKNKISELDSIVIQISTAMNHGNVLDYAKRSFTQFFNYTVFNHNYLRKYEKEMENSSIFANSIRPFMQFTNYALFHDLGDKAILGKGGWMFYKPDVEYLYKPSVVDTRSKVVDYYSQSLKDNPVNIIVDFKDQLSKLGIDLLVMIVPGKPTIYPDLISPDINISNSNDLSHSLSILQILKEKGVSVIDLFNPFLQARQQDTLFGDSLYLHTDTHWKTRAPRIAADVTASAIKQMSWFCDQSRKLEYIIDTVDVYRNGDIGVMTKLPEFKIRDLQINLPLEKTKCYQVFSVNRNDSGEIVSKELYRDDYKRSRILILGDSFSRIYQTDEPRSAGWISHLAFELSEPLASIVNDGGASTIVRQILSRKASLLKGKKLVIWEFIERDLRFGAEGWKEIDIPFAVSKN